MPATLCSVNGWKRNPIRPVFFAPTDIQPGGLTEEIKGRLRQSQHLIVICSPNSAKSHWVGEEIAYFHSLGRTDKIHFFIVDGEPHSANKENECFNPIIGQLLLPEILGANIHEKISVFPWINKERALVQLVTKLLHVEFDSIWQRHKRQMFRKTLCWIFGTILVSFIICGVWKYNKLVDVRVSLREVSKYNEFLPQLTNGKVTMLFENDTIEKRIKSIDEEIYFKKLPSRAMGEEVHMVVIDSVGLYYTVDTTVRLSQNIMLNISRNPQKYGVIKFRLLDAQSYLPIENCEIQIEGQSDVSDKNGNVFITIPVERQRTEYKIHSTLTLETDICLGEYDADGFVIFANCETCE